MARDEVVIENKNGGGLGLSDSRTKLKVFGVERLW